MRKPINLLLVFAMVAALAAPVVASAQDGRGKSGEGDGGSRSTASKSDTRGDRDVDKAARKAADRAERVARKAQRDADKAARKIQRDADKAARKAAREASRSVDADEATGSVEPTGSVETTRAVGSGILRAFARITTNLEKSLAKIAEGQKKQLPPGLVRAWLKFATWLGVDKATMPGLPKSDPNWTVEPTGTVEPTTTVQPPVTPIP